MSHLKSWASGAGAAAIAVLFAVPASAADVPAKPTYTKDVAPIFQAKCEACHRADSIAPMSLQTYEEARPFVRAIKQRVETRQMPPWHIDKTVGIQKFKNDRSLTDAELQTIVNWIDSGAPMGNKADMPPAVKWPTEQGWNFASMFGQTEPDLIIKSTPYTQKGNSPDAWWHPVSDAGITEPRWVRAIELRPGTVKGRKITHHAIARLSQDESLAPAQFRAPVGDNTSDDDAAAARLGGGTFMEWAVGKQGELMRPGSGKLLLPGARFTWDVHYSRDSKGEDVTDHVEMGIYFYPKGQEPKYRQHLSLYGTGCCDIAPNEVRVTTGLHVMRQAARIESFQPHMHLRGKAMMMEAVMPNGQTQILSYVNDFNFNWHNVYVFADDAAPLLPKGAMLRITSWHDNTGNKKSNPDPNMYVSYGDRTVDEMAHAWINITFMSDADYDSEVAARRAATTTQQQQ